MFIVCYYNDLYDSCNDIFVTENEQTAIDYCNRFNSKLKKWKEYVSQFDDDKDEVPEHLYHRYHEIKYASDCYYYEIEKR